jgi:hypothetical protein
MRLAKILFAALGCFCLLGCVQQPVINYKDCVVKLSDLQSASAKINFAISNPNIFPLYGKVSYTLFVQEKELTAGQTDTIEAEANTDTDFVKIGNNKQIRLLFNQCNRICYLNQY